MNLKGEKVRHSSYRGILIGGAREGRIVVVEIKETDEWIKWAKELAGIQKGNLFTSWGRTFTRLPDNEIDFNSAKASSRSPGSST